VRRDAAVMLAFGGCSPATVDRLVRRHGSQTAAVTAVTDGRTKLSKRVRSAVGIPADVRWEQLRTAGVQLMASTDPAFPSRLQNLSGAPRWLFVDGSLPLGPAIGIVGSRSATAYGLDLAHEYGSVASRAGWHVVSGLARGIDAAAHRGVVEALQADSGSGRAVGVLGCGIDVVYPRRNRQLYGDLRSNGGVLVSEYPPGTPPEGWRFPTRNRIIAGLCDVVLVVEASRKGGALITARIALEYGVSVYAVPGDIDRETSMGTNELIRDGAFPVFGAEDLRMVLELLSPIVNRFEEGRSRRYARQLFDESP